jgi:hypothetical protein
MSQGDERPVIADEAIMAELGPGLYWQEPGPPPGGGSR